MTEPSADAHPFRVAWETRDLDVLASRFADDIELRSPLLAAPFRGRAAATEVYGAVFEALGAITWVAETATETGRIFQWSAESGGRRFDGIDVLEIDGDGRITAITVFIRPLAGLGAFAAAAGPAMARRRGRARALALRVLGPVLRGFTWMADRTAARMVRP